MWQMRGLRQQAKTWYTTFAIIVCIVSFVLSLGVPTQAHAAWPVTRERALLLEYLDEYSTDDACYTHHGIDIAADANDEIFAPIDGVVSFTGAVPAVGRVSGQTMQAISISLDDGRTMTFMPVEECRVEEGDAVISGMSLGTIAATGDVSCVAPHLHVGLKRGNSYYDPLDILGGTGSTPASVSREDESVYADAASPEMPQVATAPAAFESPSLVTSTPQTVSGEHEAYETVTSNGVTLGADRLTEPIEGEAPKDVFESAGSLMAIGLVASIVLLFVARMASRTYTARMRHGICRTKARIKVRACCKKHEKKSVDQVFSGLKVRIPKGEASVAARDLRC